MPVPTWYGLAGPAKLPKEIVDRLNGEVRAIVNQKDRSLKAHSPSAFPESPTGKETNMIGLR